MARHSDRHDNPTFHCLGQSPTDSPVGNEIGVFNEDVALGTTNRVKVSLPNSTPISKPLVSDDFDRSALAIFRTAMGAIRIWIPRANPGDKRALVFNLTGVNPGVFKNSE